MDLDRSIVNEAPPPSLRELDDHNLVIYLNSFSKVMAPGLRLGWIAAAPSIVEQIAIIKQRLDPHTPNLIQMAVARLMREGAFDSVLPSTMEESVKRLARCVGEVRLTA
jgi:2-aminoadipate transaminase